MNCLLLGAAGFIGTNLAIRLSKEDNMNLILVDQKKEYFLNIEKKQLSNATIKVLTFSNEMDFDKLVDNIDVVYHLVSTSIPANSNQHIPLELESNVIFTSYLLEACVRKKVSKVVFVSSGGTVYGKETQCPLNEETPTYPITSYGIQKITIEKLLYLYKNMYNLDYRIIRLSNPYGPYQRPDGILGAVTTFTYKAMIGEPIIIYGDGSVIRDFIYIEDAINAMIKITCEEAKYKTYNVGSGIGVSIRRLVETIQKTLNVNIDIQFSSGRAVDVPVNYLDISRYEDEFGKLALTSLEEGIGKTFRFLKD